MSSRIRHSDFTRSRIVSGSLAAIAAGLLLFSLKLPLWQMRLEAPQYKDEEALKIAVHANAFRGDLRELKVLNQYIGVHVPPTLPQFKWLPGALIAAAALGLAAAFLRAPTGPRISVAAACALCVALGCAALQAKSQMHDIGHKRDQKTILAGMRDFTPPFLGTTRIAQFTVSSRFGVGAWLIGGAVLLQLGGAWLHRNANASFAQMASASGSHEALPHVGQGFAGRILTGKLSHSTAARGRS